MPSSAPHGTTSRYTYGCRCDECRGANTQAAARRRANRVAAARKGEIPASVRHGQSTARNWGCRCDVCVAAYRAWSRRQRERAKDGVVAHPRGGWSPYCKCDACQARAALRRKSLNSEARVVADRHGYQWTGPELEVAARTDLTKREVAAMLGRTVASVATVRQRLRNEPALQRRNLPHT